MHTYLTVGIYHVGAGRQVLPGAPDLSPGAAPAGVGVAAAAEPVRARPRRRPPLPLRRRRRKRPTRSNPGQIPRPR